MRPAAAGSAQRLETYTRVSVYALLAVSPMLYVDAFPWWGPAAGVAVGLAQAAAEIVICRRAITMLRQGERRLTRRQGWLLAAFLACSALVFALIVAQATPGSGWLPALCAAGGAPMAAVAVLLTARTTVGATVLLGLVIGTVGLTRAELAPAAGVLLTGWVTVLLVAMVMSFWLTGWMLRNIWALEEARLTAAQLAIAQERLRIGRDLHDLFGRTMAAVSVKSELAAELVRRGRDDAALAQMAEVRAIAEQTGQHVRTVVQGYRQKDLDSELAGSRALLDSAGIRCVVRGAVPVPLDGASTEALCWVLQEAVTNVIRHSTARECLISIDGEPPSVRLTITNDGAPDRLATGNGLLGMHERLAAVGGVLRTAEASGGRFTVEAVIGAEAGR